MNEKEIKTIEKVLEILKRIEKLTSETENIEEEKKIFDESLLKIQIEKILNVEKELLRAFPFNDTIKGEQYWVEVIKSLKDEIRKRKKLLNKD